MKEITKEVLKQAAGKLMFEMTDGQYDLLEIEFGTLLRQMSLIGEISGIDDAIPMTFPFPVVTEAMREDTPQEPTPAKDILRNAAHVEENQIKVPKVVG